MAGERRNHQTNPQELKFLCNTNFFARAHQLQLKTRRKRKALKVCHYAQDWICMNG